MVRLQPPSWEQAVATKQGPASYNSFCWMASRFQKHTIESCFHLLLQLLIERHGFDMRKHMLMGF
jgi:hypothetical protein